MEHQHLLQRIEELEKQLSKQKEQKPSYEELRVLKKAIMTCPVSKAGAIIKILVQAGVSEDDDEEIDLEELDVETIRKLQTVVGKRRLREEDAITPEQKKKKKKN